MKLDFKCPEKNRIRNIICLKKIMNAADYMALTHQLLSPKLYVEGVIAYGKENLRKTSEFIQSLHLEQEVKVIPGSPTVYTEHKGELSEGTRFLIECAEKEDERILNVCVYGALTEVAYAYQEAPDIMKKVTVIWCGGNAWPLGGREIRIAEDVEAAKKVFSSEMEVYQIPENTYRQIKVTPEEAQVRLKKCGEIGRKFARKIVEECEETKQLSYVLPEESVVGAAINIFDHAYERVPAPRINHEMFYMHDSSYRPIRVYYFMDSRMVLEDLYCKLELLYGKEG